jgi:lysophospholipase L1-like esterase
MKSLLACLLCCFVCSSVFAAEEPVTQIFVIGDSTVCNYSPNNPKRGWGQMIDAYFKPGVQVVNNAKGGRSTKTFINEGLWEKTLAQSKPGDFVLIQFGHNDSHPKKNPESTDAATDYKTYLTQYVNEAVAHKITPILVSPMHRRLFKKDTGKLTTELQRYATAMQQVAEEKHVVYVDLHTLSGEVMQKLGDDGSVDLFCSDKDRTHFSAKGATLWGKLIIENLASQQTGLEKLLVTP